MNIEQTLIEMCRYGEPILAKFTDKWHCRVKMTVNSENFTFEVKGYGLTPSQAADECHKNMLDAIAQLSGAVATPLNALD